MTLSIANGLSRTSTDLIGLLGAIVSRRKPVVGETILVMPELGVAFNARVHHCLSVQFTAYEFGSKMPTFLFYDPMKGTDWEYTT